MLKDSDIERLAEKLTTLESDFNESKSEAKAFQRKIESLKHDKCELEKSSERTSVMLQTLKRDKAELEDRQTSAIARIEDLEIVLSESKTTHENVKNHKSGCSRG
jgi:chromosome segregation ATPase